MTIHTDRLACIMADNIVLVAAAIEDCAYMYLQIVTRYGIALVTDCSSLLVSCTCMLLAGAMGFAMFAVYSFSYAHQLKCSLNRKQVLSFSEIRRKHVSFRVRCVQK